MFAAPFARALRRYFSGRTSAVLVGTPPETDELREAARALPEPLILVRTIDARDAKSLETRGMDPKLAPVAYLCRGNVCGQPARTTSELRAALESLSPSG